jgi:hypothetical protein
MADDKTKRGPADRTRVNINEPYEVAYWCAKWGCTPSELTACVKRVGVMAADVEACLRAKR